MFPLKQSVVICIIFHVAFSAIIEKYAGRICNLKEEKGLNECLQKAIQHLFDNYPKGSKEIGLISLDPLEISHIVMNENRGGPTQFKLELINGKQHYIPESLIKDVEYDIKNGHLKFIMDIPLTLFEGTYKMAGKILALPISGNGDASIKITKVLLDIQMDLQDKNGKDNKKYIEPKNIISNITVGKASFNFNNLFGNKDLSDNMNKFLNENDKEVVDDVKIEIESMYNKILESIVKSVFRSKPAEEFVVL